MSPLQAWSSSALTLTVLLVLVLGAGPAAVGQEDEGYWVLTGMDPGVRESDETHTYAVSDGSATLRVVAPDVGDRFVSTATWSRPNDTYRGGETVQLTLSVRVIEYVWNGTDDGYIHPGLNHMGNNVQARIDVPGMDYGGVTAGAIDLTDAAGEHSFAVYTDSGTIVVSEAGGTVSAAFPAGYQDGERKDIRVITQSGVARYTYTWVWGEAPAAVTTTTSTVPAADTVAFVEDAAGTAYYSPADEGDLEPAQRTWRLLRAGERVALGAGAMVRTGGDGTIRVRFDTGSLIRLDPSSLFSIQRVESSTTSQWVVYGRLWEGLANFYWRSGTDTQLEVETDRAIVAIQGTLFQISVTDERTQVSVFKGVVAVTDRASGTVTEVTLGQTSTIDDTGPTLVLSAQLGITPPAEALDEESGGAPAWLIVIIVLGCLAGLGVVWALARRQKRAPASPSQGLLPDEPPPPPAP